MRREDIAYYVTKKTSLTRLQAIDAVEAVIECIGKALIEDEGIYIRGFATIKPVVRAPKKARHIYKGETINLPERRTVKIIPSKELKAQMNK